MTEVTERPVRVAFVSDATPERNGVGAYYCDLAAQLPAAEFDCLAVAPGGPVKRWLRLPLPGDGTQALVLPSPRDFGRCLRAHGPEVVVCATPGPFGLLGARWARKTGTRLLIGFHTDYAAVTDVYGHPLLRVLSRRYFRMIDRWMFRRAEQVLCNSDAMIELAQSLGAHRTACIGTLLPPGVLETPVAPAGAELRRVLFAGRLAPEKRLGQVLEAARRMPKLRFTIAGEGPLRPEVERAAHELDNLDYTGWLSRGALLAQMDASDCLVLPSELESFGSVALEAMARQRLVCVTRTCGIAEWPELAEHLVVFERETPLHVVLSDLVKETPQQRRARAEHGCSAARRLNRRSLAQWQTLLAGAAQGRR
ncbi:glycosyltransferase [Wenzhouxiangella limi]|uniref:Glycosyltransferase family 1 protein n=1 Tax=Wenzhouxiangella limi TaxID=2707351 RepID=A0A845V8X0_9GAMM|nr:glycosyltransferase [Wenzhouxiangella limi]NDY96375.1 glycosyltransferase family 1 protein [Wenzhouxiangella limi]